MFKFLNIDYIYSKSSLKSLIIIILITIFLGTTIKNESVYAFITYIFLSHSILAVDSIEKKFQFNYIINSMPIKRKEIVINKYIRLQIFTILILVILFLISNMVPSLKPMRIKPTMYLWISITVLYSIYYVFYFTSNKNYIDILLIILYTSVIGGMIPILSDNGMCRFIESKLPYLKIIYIIVLVIYITSMIISIIGYERLDLK